MRHQHEETTIRYVATALRTAVYDGLISASTVTTLVEQLLYANMGMRFDADQNDDALKLRQAEHLGELGLAINAAFTSVPAEYFALETQLERDRFLYQTHGRRWRRSYPRVG